MKMSCMSVEALLGLTLGPVDAQSAGHACRLPAAAWS